ncbi:MAG: MCP four helix bundle domain-containing protein, partial [Deltaproteobacteria bacterium]|nr:MCP four helix bundle domain-containing protein [Deltaproteobacteria bacterium]
MRKVKISVKIILGFLLIAIISGIVGVMGIYYTQKITVADRELYIYNTVPLAHIGSLGINFQEMRVVLRDVVDEQDENRRKEKMDKIQKLKAENDESLKLIQEAANTKERKALVAELEKARTGFGKLLDKMTGQINSGMGEAAKGTLDTDGVIAAKQFTDAIDKLFDLGVAEAKKTSEGNGVLAKISGTVSIGLTVVNMIAAVLLGILLTFTIIRPINRVVSGLREGAE